MGAKAVPIPPVASAPVLQCVRTFDPSARIVRPCSPIRRHITRSSPQMAIASACSRSQTPALSPGVADRKSTRLNSSHMSISYAVFCLKKKKKQHKELKLKKQKKKK